MDLSEFSQGLETYGADFRRWPAGEAEAALALLQASPEAVALFAAASADDAAIFDADAAPDPALTARILRRVDDEPDA